MSKLKILIYPIEVATTQSYIPFEIKLPSHVEVISAITITTDVQDNALNSKLGTISLQSNEESDLFFQTDIFQDGFGFRDSIDSVIQILGAESKKAWITGKHPKSLRLNIDGSTGSLIGWYKSAYTTGTYKVNIYLEYQIKESE